MSLDKEEVKEQLTRYRRDLVNLLLTDHLEFRWYVEGNKRQVVRIADIESTGVVPRPQAYQDFLHLLEAFVSHREPTIATAPELANRLAAKGRLLRHTLEEILDDPNEPSDALQDLLEEYKDVLMSDLKQADFADMQTQTVIFGLFAARWLDRSGKSFTLESAVFTPTTPFLRNMLWRIAGENVDIRYSWIIKDIERLLAHTEPATLMTSMTANTPGSDYDWHADPLIYFYENFLAVYDPELRKRRGVYYTPDPVVSYIVDAVDRLLIRDFGFKEGLAHHETQASAAINQGAPSEILILDPAVGTGNFLRHVIHRIYETLKAAGQAGLWERYVKDQLLHRLFGFEIMMTPYAICHLNLARAIGIGHAAFGCLRDSRFNVFLTNTLQSGHEQEGAPSARGPMGKEAREADAVKQTRPVMVVLGNPPYSGHSKQKGEWFSTLLNTYKHSREFERASQPSGYRMTTSSFCDLLTGA